MPKQLAPSSPAHGTGFISASDPSSTVFSALSSRSLGKGLDTGQHADEDAEKRHSATVSLEFGNTLESQCSSSLKNSSSWKLRLRPREAAQACWHAFRRIPLYFWISLALLAVLTPLFVMGSLKYADSVKASNKADGRQLTDAAARSIEALLENQKAPVLALASLVYLHPNWPIQNKTFNAFIQEYSTKYPFFAAQVLPHGQLLGMEFGSITPRSGLPKDVQHEIMLGYGLGQDMFNPSRKDFSINVNSISPDDRIVLLPPFYEEGELADGAYTLRYPIFLEDDGSWQMPESPGYDALPASVKTSGNKTFWGWTGSVFSWTLIKAGLQQIEERGWLFCLEADQRQFNRSLLGHSYRNGQKAYPPKATKICSTVNCLDSYKWRICVEPDEGWSPSWRVGLCVGTAMLALLLSVLCFFVLRSHHLCKHYLTQQLETNRLLGEAKEESEARRKETETERDKLVLLMRRQEELISLQFKDERKSPNSSANGAIAIESEARERILEVRMQMQESQGTRSISERESEMQLHEVLGEGSFGKVYRGTWRGSEVAIKAIILPLSMSGNEKREKMLIMEAAISSSLAHPNIVQTYTYSIDILRQNEFTLADDAGALMLLGGKEGSSATMQGPSKPGSSVNFSRPSSTDGVHGYEVRLVLEYCDRGSLKDALSGSAFMGPRGFNYKAVLDTALDIARAMVHLHKSSVLHGDLKIHNVMLKSCSGRSSGRGVIAKVSDFGLAMKIDSEQNQTHMSGCFQGTITHMAPELLLSGHMSKAVDVYAFGITLWELFTAKKPYLNVPNVLLGHQVVYEGKRPVFPAVTPSDYVDLVSRCWAALPEDRPTFDSILETLQAMRSDIEGPTEPLEDYSVVTSADKLKMAKEAGKTAGFTAAEGDFNRLSGSNNSSQTFGSNAPLHLSPASPVPSIATRSVRSIVAAPGLMPVAEEACIQEPSHPADQC